MPLFFERQSIGVDDSLLNKATYLLLKKGPFVRRNTSFLLKGLDSKKESIHSRQLENERKHFVRRNTSFTCFKDFTELGGTQVAREMRVSDNFKKTSFDFHKVPHLAR